MKKGDAEGGETLPVVAAPPSVAPAAANVDKQIVAISFDREKIARADPEIEESKRSQDEARYLQRKAHAAKLKRQKAKTDGIVQQNDQRAAFGENLLKMVRWWTALVGFVLLFSAFAVFQQNPVFSDAILGALITSVAANVLGGFLIAIKFLFPAPKD